MLALSTNVLSNLKIIASNRNERLFELNTK